MRTYTLAGLALISGTAIAAEDIDQTLDADEDGHVNISNVSGTVEFP